MVYHRMSEYDSPMDYYDYFLTKSPKELTRDRADEYRERRQEEENTYRDMCRHRELYGD